jgi:hypothetical protein
MSAATAEETVCTFRRTRSGEWVIVGPHALLADACEHRHKVTVARKDGHVRHLSLIRTGAPFTRDGVELCYGYYRQAANDGGRLIPDLSR